eukprot:PITA_06923
MAARRLRMGISPCCSKEDGGLNRGAWTAQEDMMLREYISTHGCIGCWRSLSSKAGLKRSGKSCRLRWLNYLRPDIRRGNISSDEEELVIRLHRLLGNRWSLIAGRLPGRTGNEIKNYWNTHLNKKLSVMIKFDSRRRSPPSGDGDHSIVKCKATKAAMMPMVNKCSHDISSLKTSSTVAEMDSSRSLWPMVLEDSEPIMPFPLSIKTQELSSMETVHNSACSSFHTSFDLPEFPSSEQFAAKHADVHAFSDIISDSTGDFDFLSLPFDSAIDMKVGGFWTCSLPAQTEEIDEVFWRNDRQIELR